MPPRIPTADFIADIQRVGGDDPPTEAEYEDEGEYSANAVKDRFGTWNRALAVAGYPQRPHGAQVDVDLDAIMDRYYRRAMGLPDVADDLGVGLSTVQDRLEEADVPTDLPKNIRYLLYNPPTPVDELPASTSPSDRRLGVTRFKVTGVAAGMPVAYLEGEHTAEAVVRTYIEANRDVIESMTRADAVREFGGHGPVFREAARNVLHEFDLERR